MISLSKPAFNISASMHGNLAAEATVIFIYFTFSWKLRIAVEKYFAHRNTVMEAISNVTSIVSTLLFLGCVIRECAHR